MGTTRDFKTEPILKHLLSKPDVILVTVQYRLGPLGETLFVLFYAIKTFYFSKNIQTDFSFGH